MTEDKKEKIIVERNKKIAELKLNAENLRKVKKEFQNHLCWNCQNGYPDKCVKVAMPEKVEIDKYPFINSGYQEYMLNSFTERLVVETFVVTDCDNFVTTNEKIVSKNSVKENREAIKLARKINK